MLRKLQRFGVVWFPVSILPPSHVPMLYSDLIGLLLFRQRWIQGEASMQVGEKLNFVPFF